MISFSSTLRTFLPLLLAGAAACPLLAQDGGVDASYNPSLDGSVRYLAAQPGGGVLVSGDFRTVNGTSRGGLTRLDANGVLDPLYNPNSIAKGGPIALAADGTAFSTDNAGHVIRINADGRANPAFNANSTLVGNNTIQALAIQPDGKILVGGVFNQVGTTFTDGAYRLNADGTLDGSFVSKAGFYDVQSIALLADGTLYAAGGRGSGNAAAPVEMAKLSASGALLASYDATPSSSSQTNAAEIYRVQVQPDGKVIVAGDFATIQGAASPRIARLNVDGTVDASFNTGSGPANFDTILDLLLQPDGKLLVAGGFTSFNGVARSRVARLNADGSMDSTFDPGAGAGSRFGEFNGVGALTIQPDGKVIVGGDFDTFGGAAHQALARLGGSGTVVPPPGPQADLGLSVAKARTKFNKKGTELIFQALVAVTNTGDKASKKVNVAAFLSDDQNLDMSADQFMGSVSTADFGYFKVKKKGTLPFKVRFTTPNGIVPFTGKYIILVVDPTGKVTEDKSNNQYVFGPL